MKYWIDEVNIDGYRCDASDFVEYDFWRQAIEALRGMPGRKLLLFAEGARKDNFAAGFDLKYGFVFYDALKKIFQKKGSVRSLDSVNKVEYAQADEKVRVARYITNHDVNLSDGTPLDLFGGKEGSMAAFVVAAYMKGVPMIYNGQEVGCPVKLSYFNNSTPIDWTLNPDLTEEYQKIIGFRNSSEAIKQGDLRSFSSDDVCAFTKTFNTEEVMVIVNLRDASLSYDTPPELAGVSWKNVFNGSSLDLSGKLNLRPFEYQVLKKQ